MSSTIKLDPEASNRAIENAVRTQAQIVLESGELPDTTINGFLISGDASALLLEVTGQLPVPIERLLYTQCDALLYSDQRYRFSTSVTAVPQWGVSRSLAIGRPESLGVIDRRRFRRANLAPSTKVRIAWASEGAAYDHPAAMLNISSEGLACRVEASVAADIGVDTGIDVSFELPGLDYVFQFAATVCNKTAASEGCTILGMQFISERETADAFTRLRNALNDPRIVSSKPEVCV